MLAMLNGRQTPRSIHQLFAIPGVVVKGVIKTACRKAIRLRVLLPVGIRPRSRSRDGGKYRPVNVPLADSVSRGRTRRACLSKETMLSKLGVA